MISWRIILYLFIITTFSEISAHRSRVKKLVKRRQLSGVQKLEEVFVWKRFAYKDVGYAGQDGRVFDVPMGMAVYEDKVFLGFPRRRVESPLGLGYVEYTGNSTKSPDIIPYPNTAINSLSSFSINGQGKIVSVYRPRVDACQRLWFVDTGILYYKGDAIIVQEAAVIIIDLITNQIIKNYTLENGRDYIKGDPGGFASIALDIIDNNCEDTFAYIPDLVNYGMVVYSLKDDNSWRVQHNYFHINPEESDFNINGLKFQWDDGLFGIALGPPECHGYRTAYFHAMASHREGAVSTRVLRNQTLATRSYHGKDFIRVGNKGLNSQTTASAFDLNTGVLFFAQVGSNAVTCWNTKNGPLTSENIGIVAKDDRLLIYPSDTLLDLNNNLWVLSNKFPIYLYSQFNEQQENFRIYRVPITKAISGTVCE